MNVKTANHIVSLFIFNEFQLQLIIDKDFYYRNLNRTEVTIRGVMIYFRGLLKNSPYSRCWGYPFSESLSPWNSIETFTIPWTFPLFFFFLSLLDIQLKLSPPPGFFPSTSWNSIKVLTTPKIEFRPQHQQGWGCTDYFWKSPKWVKWNQGLN